MSVVGTNTAIGLVGYLLLVAVIGYWGARNTDDDGDFYIGGDKLPGWVLALSERSSDMSAWLLLGVPGLAWASGLSSVWVLVGAAGGAIFQWIVYSRPFMEGRKETGALTPIGLIAEKLPSDTPMLRILPAIVTFIFYMGYVGAEFAGGGTLLQNMFGLNPTTGMFLVAAIIILYSLAGGFLAVAWTDAMQALLMIFTLIVLPGILLVQVLMDPNLSIMASLEASGGGRASWLGGKTGAAALVLLGANLSWLFACLGGYPHLNVRLMAIRNENERINGIIVSTVWGILTSIGAVLLGLIARTLHGAPESLQANREFVLPYMVLEHTPGLLGGILLAGALAAMMSTADSMLIVATSAASHDTYQNVIKKGEKISQSVRLRISRVATLLIGLVGLVMAYSVTDLVYTLVSYSATGLFSSFGPAITLLFFWGDRFSKAGLYAAFLVGPIVTILWITMGLTSIVTVRLVAPPLGFAAAIIASLIWPSSDQPTSQLEGTPAVQD